LTNDDGAQSTIKDLSGIKNNKYYTDLKNDLLQGKQHPACDRCWKMEPESFRNTVYNKQSAETFEKIIEQEPKHLPLEHMSISIGNTCNLNCRMCDPNSSSMIAKEWQREHPLGRGMHYNDLIVSDVIQKNNNFLGDPLFLQYVKENYKDLKEVYIFGGEPFIIIEEHLSFLKLLVDLGVSKNIRISYSTNGTNTNLRRFIDLWKNFKEISFSISIDGIEETYDYIRWPNVWSKAEKSIEFFHNLVQDNENFSMSIACTVQLLNITSMERFVNYIVANYTKNYLFFIPVGYPAEFSIKGVPLNVLQEVYSKNLHPQLNSIIKPFIDDYDEQDSKANFNDLIKVATWQDEYREQSLYEFYPEIRNWHGGV
jgi:MoaA/NifB/PqqE/SkfB family radical SAM enzyme